MVIRGLRCSVSGRNILDDVSLNIAPGEFVSIIGPNGAGKTTLLKCLIRVVPCQAGEIVIAGRSVSDYGTKELARLLAYVPQADARHVPFSVEEYVLTGRYPHLSPFSYFTREDREAVDAALSITGTAGLAGRRVATLSGGERQLVMIAAAVAQEAKLLLLDEPTAFLDPRHQSDVLSLLDALNRRRGVTVLMVTHDINHAILAGNRIAMLDAGRLVYDGAADMIAADGVLERTYRKRFRFMPHPQRGRDIVVPDVNRDEC